jgi:hypothetical protein
LPYSFYGVGRSWIEECAVRESPRWKETHLGGSPDSEQALFHAMIKEMRAAGLNYAAGRATHRGLRMMFGKTVIGVENACLKMDNVIPADLAVGHFRPGASLPAVVRLSNASPAIQTDSVPDMRGLAVRLVLPSGAYHDLLFANCPTSFARNAEQFYEFSVAEAAGREALFARLAKRIGLEESRRIALHLKSSLRLCSSLTREHFWSGSAFLWGNRPVRHEFRPADYSGLSRGGRPLASDALRVDFADRLADGDVRFRFALQQYVDEKHTPIEDATINWSQRAAPSLELGTLIVPQQNILGPEGMAALERVDSSAFTPWNTLEPFRPLGSLNRLRRLVYQASKQTRVAAID